MLLLRGSLADSYRVTAEGRLIAVSVKQAAAEVFMPSTRLFLYVYKSRSTA